MRRQEFIAGLGGAVAAWPLGARAQQGDRMRRIGVLMSFVENDPEGKAQLSGFTQALAKLGWTDGRNARMDVRWGAGNIDRMRTFAKELVDLQPDVILSHTTAVTVAFQRETRTIPIVFVSISDPVGDGFVAGLPRPGGNITGFISMEAGMAGKWLELLTEIAPAVKRAAIMFANSGGSYYLPSFEAAARSLKVASIAAPVHSEAEIETVMTSLGREPRGGLVLMPDSFVLVHRAPIIALAARNNVPARNGDERTGPQTAHAGRRPRCWQIDRLCEMRRDRARLGLIPHKRGPWYNSDPDKLPIQRREVADGELNVSLFRSGKARGDCRNLNRAAHLYAFSRI